MEDKFKLYKKWFWVGIIVGFLNVLAGLIYGVALILEPEHRKEGVIISLWSALIFVLIFVVVGPQLQ